jgi:lipoyl synthase
MEALDQLALVGWEVRERNFPPVLRCNYPHKTMAISVTGDQCQLNCAHCGGHYLKQMKSLADISAAGDLQNPSCLISGGCTKAGKVPVVEHAATLKELKQGRKFNMHVGLVEEAELETIAQMADCVSFDFVGDDATIHDVFGINRTVDDYIRCYQSLRSKVPVMPHICIGLHGGKIQGEYRAIELLKELGTDGLTFIIFTPTRGSRYAQCAPPSIDEVVKLLVYAREIFPNTPIHLGCMRPGARYRNELDRWAVRAGINTIVNPTPAAVSLAQQLGLQVERGEECCSL